MRIRRRLRSARASALSAEERCEELRAAVEAAKQDDRPTPGAGATRDATPTSRAGIP